MLSCDDLTGRGKGGGGGGGERGGGSGWVHNGIAEVFVLIGPHWLLKTGGISKFEFRKKWKICSYLLYWHTEIFFNYDVKMWNSTNLFHL